MTTGQAAPFIICCRTNIFRMPANEKAPGKKPVKKAIVRSLKIQPQFRGHCHSQRRVPVIRLGGVWLERLGFNTDQRVTVTTMNKLIIIQLEEQAGE